MTHWLRVILIRASKTIPFILAFIVLVSYIESLIALLCNDYIFANEFTALHKYISPIIAYIYVYDWSSVIVMMFLAFCFQTCLYNKLCIAYLTLNLVQKGVFMNMNVVIDTAIMVCAINIFVASFFIYKGFIKVNKSKK